MDRTVAGVDLLNAVDGTSDLPVERRTLTAYDDVREESGAYSHDFAEDDPDDGGQVLLIPLIQEPRDG